MESKKKIPADEDLWLVVDRIGINEERDTVSRVSESVETAIYEGKGECFIEIDGELRSFSNRFEADGMTFTVPTPNMFSFNSPIGACPKCEGYGRILGIDEDLVVPNKSLSVYEDAVMCWRGEKMSEWKNELIRNAHKVDFPVHKPYYELNQKEKELLWNGCSYFGGIYDFFTYLESKKYKIQNRVMNCQVYRKDKMPVVSWYPLES